MPNSVDAVIGLSIGKKYSPVVVHDQRLAVGEHRQGNDTRANENRRVRTAVTSRNE